MEGGGIRKLHCWDELYPELLALIFTKLSLLEILTVIPSVCKSWGKVVSGSYCWQEINITEWSRRHRHQSEKIDRMLQMLIKRSFGSLRKLSVYGLSNGSTLSFIADHASCLQTLELPKSGINYSILEQVAEKLSTITFLDISHCTDIGGSALNVIGKHCKSLVGLRRVMEDYEIFFRKGMRKSAEAHAIAATMPKLKYLVLANPHVTTAGVVKILTSCRELEFLDVSGCQNVMLDEQFLKERCSSGLKVLVPNPNNTRNSNASDWDPDYLAYLVHSY